MNKLETGFLTLLVSGLVFSAWDPFTPRLSELTREPASVKRISGTGRGVKVVFETRSGTTVTCRKGWKRTMCRPEDFQEYEGGPALITVWHDGERVYQADTSSRRVFSYSSRYEEPRWFSAVLALIFSFPLLVELGRRVGIVNPSNSVLDAAGEARNS